MAEELNLGPDEAIVLRMENVAYGEGFPFPSDNNVLILTTRNIVLLKKNLFGQTSDTIKFPLSEIKVVNGVPQVRKGKIDIVTSALEVYFASGMERFQFEWDSDIDEWISHIVSLITGVPVKEKTTDDMLAEAMALAESIEAPIEKMRDIFGIKSTKQVSCKCPSCGATLTGIKGETTQCPYCGTYHTF